MDRMNECEMGFCMQMKQMKLMAGLMKTIECRLIEYEVDG
jgi:hypothetical protein